MSEGREFVLLLKNRGGLGKRMIPAYLNASLRWNEGEARAKSLPIEMLLFLAGTMRVNKAIDEAGASESENFVIFATSSKILSRFVKETKVRKIKMLKLDLDLDVAVEVASAGLLE